MACIPTRSLGLTAVGSTLDFEGYNDFDIFFGPSLAHFSPAASHPPCDMMYWVSMLD